MPDLLGCPDLERYHELASGRLPAANKDALLEHLESCDACAQKLGTLSPRETLVELLRQAKTYCEGESGEEVVRLVERLSKLNPLETPTLHEEAKTPPPQGPLTFRCSECGKNLKAPQSVAGKKVKCPHCQKAVSVPGVEMLTCTVHPPQGKQLDGATLAPSAPVSLTDAGSVGGNRPTPSGGDTIGQDGNQDPELTEFLAPAQASDELGRLGPYRVLAILGAGGMGVVYKAEDPKLKRLVALKAMLPGLGASTSARKRFLREAQSAAAIKHDHIVSIYQVDEERGVPYLAMEFLSGEPLDERLKRDKNLPLTEMLRIGCEMAEGLAAAHEAGLIHRDIKPANVWLEGKKARVKILDFGLARAADEQQNLTHAGAIVGTPAYMAPEQAQGKPVDRRCDLFSLGVVLYRLCTAQMPFQGTDTVSTLMAVSTHEPPAPIKLNAQLPSALSDLVMHLLAKDPAQRVGSAEEVVRALTELQRQVAAGAIAEPMRGHSAPPKQAPVSLDKTNPDTVTKDVPGPAKASLRSRRNFFLVVGLAGAAALLLVLLGGGALVYQLMFRTGNGTLIVEVEGKDADLRFKDGKLHIYDADGKKLLYTLAPSDKNKTLPFGKYQIKVEGADGLVLDTDHFEMTQQGSKVRVSVAPSAIARKGPDGQDQPPVVPAEPPSAEKGVLDYAEIHDADENRFDAWIAQLQKDGFRPVSLSIQAVKNAPRYTSVAVKEERKRLWEFTRATFGKEVAQLENMAGKNYGPAIQNVFTDAGKHRLAFVWLWNMPRTWIWTGDKVFIDNKIVEAASEKLRPVYRSANDEGDHIAYSVVFAPDDGIPSNDAIDLSPSECKALIEKQKADGWRPKHIYAYGAGAKLLFGVTLVQEKDRPDWDLSWSLTPAQYEAELSARKQEGFRPHTTVGHDDDAGTLRFRVIWIRYRDLNGKEAGELSAPDLAKVKLKAPTAAFKHKIGMEFALIPKGKAWLDGGNGKEGTRPVTFERDFYLGMYEVTQQEWETVMGFKHAFHFSRKGEGNDALAGVTDAELKRFPVENVSWNECQLFLKKLNELDKKPGWEYRLPTEAEWEYACRGGPGDKFQSAFDFYLQEPTNLLLTSQANFEHDKGLKRTRQVGSYPPNKLGLFDMHGNVAELTHDAQPEQDDVGNPKRNERGGGWTNNGDQCKATGRFGWSPADRFRDVGLRVALVPAATMKK